MRKQHLSLAVRNSCLKNKNILKILYKPQISDIQLGLVQTKAVYAERVFMKYLFNDGGRKAAGYKGTAGDCGARAMAIALGLDYQAVYKELAQANANVGKAKSARNGIGKEIYTDVLKKHGWVWKSAPKFDGRKARCSDMPRGVVIAHQAHHFVAVIDGVANDIFDCTHRMVYGYWAKA